MKLTDRIKSYFADPPNRRLPWVDEEKAIASQIFPWMTSSPQYPADNFYDFAKGGFSKNEIVYACITLIMDSFKQGVFAVYEADGSPIENHPLSVLLSRPNPFMSGHEFYDYSILYLLLSGNCFWEKVRGRSGRVVELWPMRPDRIRIVPSETKYIGGYVYEIGGQKYQMAPEDVIHVKLPDPLNDFFGMPPLRAALRATATDNELTDFTKVMLQNRAIPGVLIKTVRELDKTQLAAAEERWRQKFSGEGRGKPLFLSGIEDVKTLGFTMEQLTFPDLSAISETRICMCFNVKPIQISSKAGLDRSTYSNSEQAELGFWQGCMTSHFQRFARKIDAELLPEFDSNRNRYTDYDLKYIPALKDYEAKQWARVGNAIAQGWLTVEAGKQELGLEVHPGDDVYLRGLATIATPIGTNGNTRIRITDAETNEELPPAKSKRLALPKTKARRDLQLLRIALGRTAYADRYYQKIHDWAKGEFVQERKDILKIYDSVSKALRSHELQLFLERLGAATLESVLRMEKSGRMILLELLLGSAELAGAEIGIDFDRANPFAEKYVQEYSFKFAKRLGDTSEKQIREVIMRGQTEGIGIREQRNMLLSMFDDWTVTRAEMVSRTETIRAANHGSKLAYRDAGVRQVEWLAASDGCPFCMALNGKQIDIDASFLDLGESLQPEGTEVPININYESVDTPPLHPNCRCTVIAVIGE